MMARNHSSHRTPPAIPAGIAALLIALLLLVSPALGAEDAASVHLTILHTNDIHGHVHARPMGRNKLLAGGIARIAGYAAKVRKEAEAGGAYAVLVDAGDIYAGTPEGNLSKGRLCIELMNSAGYEMGCIGNHEFDDGADNLAALAKAARFPLIGSNIRLQETGARPDWARAYVIREFGDLKVAFLGVVTVETADISSGGSAVRFLDEAKMLKATHRLAREEGAVLSVALTHVGFDRDKELAGKVPAVPLLIGGHSHTYLKKIWEHPETGVRVVQAGCHATHIGRLELDISPAGEIRALDYRMVWLGGHRVPPDPRVEAELEEKSASIRKTMDRPLGNALAEVERGGRRFSGASSPLGNLLADLMRKAAGADLAFHNRTGIRDTIPGGAVTFRDVYRVCPFGNTVYAMDLAGKDVLALLEYALSKGNRYLLEISGAAVVYDPEKESGQRVVSVTVGTEPLDPEAVYRVATSNFIAAGGDGHEVFERGTRREDTGTLLRDRLAAWIEDHQPFRVEYTNRIRKKE